MALLTVLAAVFVPGLAPFLDLTLRLPDMAPVRCGLGMDPDRFDARPRRARGKLLMSAHRVVHRPQHFGPPGLCRWLRLNPD